MSLTKEMVLEKLSGVMDPELHRDLVSLGMIKKLEVNQNNISLTVELTTPACPLKEKIRADVTKALKTLDGVKDIKIEMTGKGI
jgi:ATP-binding protein involved in chromosome partitioning